MPGPPRRAAARNIEPSGPDDLTALATNSAGPFASRIRRRASRAGPGRTRPPPSSRRRWSSEKPSQTWPICCRYSSRSCGSMSRDQQAAAGTQHPGRRRPARRPGRARGAARAAASPRRARRRRSGSASSSPWRTSTFGQSRSRRRAACSMSPERSTAIDAGHERRQRGRHLSGAAAEVAHDPALVEQSAAAPGGRGAAEQIRRAACPSGRRPIRRTAATPSAAARRRASPAARPARRPARPRPARAGATQTRRIAGCPVSAAL